MITETSEDNVFCVDCKYSTGGNFVKTWWMRLTRDKELRCSKDRNQRSETNLVTGKVIKIFREDERCKDSRGSSYKCGPSGKNWVPYSKHKMFLYLKRTGGNDGTT